MTLDRRVLAALASVALFVGGYYSLTELRTRPKEPTGSRLMRTVTRCADHAVGQHKFGQVLHNEELGELLRAAEDCVTADQRFTCTNDFYRTCTDRNTHERDLLMIALLARVPPTTQRESPSP